MTTHSPSLPPTTETSNPFQPPAPANPSRVLENEPMQKELLPAVVPEQTLSTAYPVAPAHVIHVSSELMSATPFPVYLPARPTVRWWPLVATAVLALGAGYFWFRPLPSNVSLNQEPHIATIRAMKAPLDSCLFEQGILESPASLSIANPVSATPVTLESMTPYGTRVKKGDVVAKLQLATLHSAIADQQSKILAARMKLSEAQEALETLKAKNEVDLSAAELQVEFAQSDLTRYQNEEKQVELNDRRGQIAMAERDLKESEEKLNYYRTFHKRGFISSEQLKAKEAELDRSRFALAQSQSRLKIFERYMVPRQERTLQVKVDDVKRDLNKLKKTQLTALAKAQADISASKGGLTLEEQKLNGLQAQLAFAEVKAPRDGILAAPLAEAQKVRPTAGATLQPGQAIYTMPDLANLSVRIRLTEADKNKLQVKQKARVVIDSDDELVCTGTLEKIDFQAESSWNQREKEPRDFVATIKLCSKQTVQWVSLGQKAHVEFTLETLPAALQVPTSAITEKDGKSYVTVLTQGGPETRELRTGGTNGKHVEVRHGLEAGEKVMLGSKLRHETADAGRTATP